MSGEKDNGEKKTLVVGAKAEADRAMTCRSVEMETWVRCQVRRPAQQTNNDRKAPVSLRLCNLQLPCNAHSRSTESSLSLLLMRSNCVNLSLTPCIFPPFLAPSSVHSRMFSVENHTEMPQEKTRMRAPPPAALPCFFPVAIRVIFFVCTS